MVIDTASKLISFLDGFDPSNKNHHLALTEIVKKHPHFHFVQPYFLKTIEQQQPEKFDEVLSHTAIATLDRQLLYEFLENPKSTAPSIELTQDAPEKTVKKKKTVNKKPINTTVSKETTSKKEQNVPKELPFSGWANYLRSNSKSEESSPIDEKFELFDAFLKNKRTVKLQKEKTNNVDLSKKSLASTDELMTETLAKVFVKQKKFENALQAYQILSLKYPEKNSFFADQIKEIKRLQKLK
ncbi:hypothetical protein N9R44_02480 [Flavobacteriaceae bacterium]|nr:hypothetical protein [Flavobacteriaceae bacterium]